MFGRILGYGDRERYDKGEDKVVTSLKWPSHALGLFAKMFSLQLKGSTLSRAFGERCILMILTTACRILYAKVCGEDDKRGVCSCGG